MLGKRSLIGLATLAIALCVAPGPTSATENGLVEYPIGVNTVVPAILPPPGATMWYNYNELYTANQFSGSNGNAAVPGFGVTAVAEAVRPLHTWKGTLGHFTLTSGFAQPFVNVDIRVAGAKDNRFGLGDTALQPLYIGYVSPGHNFFAYTGVDVYIPTGAYDKAHVANQGLNVYSFSPQVNLTYFVTHKLELSASNVFEWHTTNPVTHYHSGAIFNFDCAVNYRLIHALPSLSVGLQGYVFNQFSDDTVNGVRFLDGFRGHANSIGGQVLYGIGKGGIALKFQPEFNVRNRSQGKRIWFQFATPI